jgi:exopolyphosphatase/guanosine-5'-triphosphate,3'-diphosphate pyrophosphatase
MRDLPSDAGYRPGRYAAVDVGTNSVLVLVADVDPDGGLTSIVEKAQITRLGQDIGATGQLAHSAVNRTLRAVSGYVVDARDAGATCMAIIGTAVLREAANGDSFSHLVHAACGLPVEVISGEQEAELAWLAQARDPALGDRSRPRVVLDIGGGSTEIVYGYASEITYRASFPLGAVRLTEAYLKSDPPSAAEFGAAENVIEQTLSPLEPADPDALAIGTGGTLYNLGAVARAGGMIAAPETHGAELPHTRVSELVDLLRSLPVRFRQRIPSLEPGRADVILAGAMILHQAMAALSRPRIRVSARGIRHGCVLALAQRARVLIGS